MESFFLFSVLCFVERTTYHLFPVTLNYGCIRFNFDIMNGCGLNIELPRFYAGQNKL